MEAAKSRISTYSKKANVLSYFIGPMVTLLLGGIVAGLIWYGSSNSEAKAAKEQRNGLQNQVNLLKQNTISKDAFNEFRQEIIDMREDLKYIRQRLDDHISSETRHSKSK